MGNAWKFLHFLCEEFVLQNYNFCCFFLLSSLLHALKIKTICFLFSFSVLNDKRYKILQQFANSFLFGSYFILNSQSFYLWPLYWSTPSIKFTKNYIQKAVKLQMTLINSSLIFPDFSHFFYGRFSRSWLWPTRYILSPSGRAMNSSESCIHLS